MARDVVVVESDERVGALVAGMLEAAAFRVRCAASPSLARERVRERTPDVIVLELAPPLDHSVELMRELDEMTGAPILVVTRDRSSADVLAAIRAGASGFLYGKDLARRLLPAIDELLDGGAPFSTDAVKVLMGEVRAGITSLRRHGPRLTPREREVLEQLARGLTYDQVAMVLGVSGNTVRTHVRTIYEKLDAATRTEAVLTAMQRGWLSAG